MRDAAHLGLHRNCDDATSTAGSEHIARRLNRIKDAFMSALADESLTAREVAARVATDTTKIESCRKRAAELVRRGMIVIVGKRRCRCTGMMANVYSLASHSNEKDRGEMQGSQRS